MKKVLAIILILTMAASLFPGMAAAAGTPGVTISATEAQPGETVTVTLSMTDNPGISFLRIPLVYDKAQLELLAIDCGGSCLSSGNWTVNLQTGILLWVNADDVTGDGQLASLSFRVKDGASEGLKEVSMGSVEANNANEDDVVFTTAAGGVTVTPTVENNPSLSVSAAEAQPGETVTITLSMTGNPGISFLRVPLAYDKEQLELLAIDCSGSCLSSGNWTVNLQTGILVWVNADDVIGDGRLASLSFRVKDGASEGLKEVSMGSVEANNANEDDVVFTTAAGGVTVTAAATEPIDENLKFASRSITLQNNLQVNYKVQKSVIDGGGYTDPYVVFNMDGTEVTVTGALDSANTYYVFSFRNIAPHRINDSFTATLYATLDGELHTGVTLSYSISQYCYNQLNKLSAQSEFATLLVDLLNYGAQSQVYTGHNTGNLANAQLTTEQAAWGTSADPTYTTVQDTQYETVENPSVTWTALGLYLEDTVSIRLKLAVADTTGLTIRVRDDKGHTWSYDASALKATGDQYYFYFSGLNADQMRETVYITAYRNDAAVSNTVRYSIESYCKAKAGGEDALSQILNAMMKYGDSAYNYAH